jgi:Tetracyclin repressor-like, C-terminal domain
MKALLTRMFSKPDGQAHRYTSARFELMGGTRRPELRPFLTELQTAAVKSATLIFEGAGLNPEPRQMEELNRLLNGYVFSSLTIPGAPDDTARLVDRLLRAFLDAYLRLPALSRRTLPAGQHKLCS